MEIYEGLKSIGNDKAPGIDGHNAYFFKNTWQIVKKYNIVAVKRFFSTGTLYKPIHCTLVSLVPKVHSPVTVKEYRPIVCCSVLYKIISKVLTMRLHDVVATIICDGQVGFVPGRKTSDNIILAHEIVKAYTR